jgi:hypothetical protein
MSILAWNCRGLGNLRTVRDLRLMVKEKSPNFLFLMETKARNSVLQKVRTSIGFEGLFTVEPVGRSGGLALLWKDAREVMIKNYSLRHITTTITMVGSEYSWKFTRYYGQPNSALRGDSWNLLTYLSRIDPSDWLCIGDFNEIIDNTEKFGGAVKSTSQLNCFRSALEECSLGDPGYKGSKFTWCNDREGAACIKERLDQALATEGWCEHFSDVKVEVLAARSSDHKPLWVRLVQKHYRVHRGFKYEAC